MAEKNASQLIIYQTETGETKIDVRFQDETVWLSQQLMAELFQTTKQNISLHTKNIIDEGELLEVSVVKEFLTVQKEGNRQVTRSLELNNLVEQYLIFAEGQAMRRIPMSMKDWIKKLDGFLHLNERNILAHAGKISHQLAAETAEAEYEKYAGKRQLAYDKKGSAFDALVHQTAKKLVRKKRVQ